jgi:hypothetical protein
MESLPSALCQACFCRLALRFGVVVHRNLIKGAEKMPRKDGEPCNCEMLGAWEKDATSDLRCAMETFVLFRLAWRARSDLKPALIRHHLRSIGRGLWRVPRYGVEVLYLRALQSLLSRFAA